MKTVTVYPTKASALNVKHPQGPKMALGGVIWPLDSFTGRRLRDRSVTTDKAKAYVPETQVAASAPSAQAATTPAATTSTTESTGPAASTAA